MNRKRPLDDAFAAFSHEPFPAEVNFADVHLATEYRAFYDDLVLYDAAVAGVIDRVTHNLPVPSAVAHLLEFDESRLKRLEALERRARELGLEVRLEDHYAHLKDLKNLIDMAREMHGQR